MNNIKKVVLHSLQGYRPELDALVADWIREGIKYVGIVGVEASRIEDAIDWLCIGDGSNAYFMLTASHGPDESFDDAMLLAGQISAEEFGTKVRVVEF